MPVKALRLLQEANVILYDSLISDEIMEFVPDSASKVYVGTRSGDPIPREQRQQEINELMLKHHNEGSDVVRLKSGDPFILLVVLKRLSS